MNTERIGDTKRGQNGGARWFLTTGSNVVGPVATELLLRGISAGRVPRGCYAARERWSGWRQLEQIREVAEFARARQLGHAALPQQFVAPMQQRVTIDDFRGAEDIDDCLKIALRLAVKSCAAEVGLVHRALPPHVGLVTTHAYGRALRSNLGEVVPWHDESRGAALAGNVLLGAPDDAEWARPTARRVGAEISTVRGAAVLPLRIHDGQQALLELGRSQHSFRISDERRLIEIRGALVQRVDQLRF